MPKSVETIERVAEVTLTAVELQDLIEALDAMADLPCRAERVAALRMKLARANAWVCGS